MTNHLSLDLAPYILSALIAAVISVDILRRRAVSGAFQFAVLAAFESLWAVGYVLQAVQTSLPGMLFWNNVQFIGAVLAPVAFLWFATSFTSTLSKTPARLTLASAGLSIALLAFIWTDSWHHLFRVSPTITPGDPFVRLVFIDGPAFFLFPLIGYSTLLVAASLLLRHMLTSARIYRLQTLTVLSGILIPWITSLVTWLNLVPLALHDVTPLTFGPSNLIVAWALTRYGLFDLVPVAYDTLVNHMEDGLLILDGFDRVIDLNRAAQDLLNITFRDTVGMPFRYLHPDFAGLLTAAANGPAELVIKVDQKLHYFEARRMPLHTARQPGGGWLVLLRDITARKEEDERLQRMAITDPLTDIYNRRQFFALAEAEFKRAIRSRMPFSVILIDIDRFKNINDRFGHIAGDQVLQQAVIRLQQHLRPYDIIARFGGDEFVVLLPETDQFTAAQIAERLRLCVSSTPFVTQAGPLAGTISLGLAAYDSLDLPHLDQLVDHADQALYEAKQQGRDRVRVWEQPEMTTPGRL